jgi:phenylalanyl-tRNA synthetase alpha chain
MPKEKNKEVEQIVLSLSPLEKEILPFLKLKDSDKICAETGLDATSVNRALTFLANKGLVALSGDEKKVVKADINGILYLKKGLPERRLLSLVVEKTKPVLLNDAKKASGLTDNEFTIALGALKEQKFVSVESGGKIALKIGREEAMKKFPEEKFIEALPIEQEKMDKEQHACLERLQKRKSIVSITTTNKSKVDITQLGQEIISKLPEFKQELIEQLTPDMIKKGTWRGKQFRRYDIMSKAPKLYGGKSHFVNQAIDYAKNIWIELGFEEMTGDLVQTAFWNFDALFTAQAHPVREMQDTFYIKDVKGELPKQFINKIRKAHESGTSGSKGWQYAWSEDEAKKVVLRTHTTCLSAHTLAKLAELKDKKGKFFALGKCFRNETVDWSHSFEFNQTEGIVVDKNANFRHLLGYLQEFYKKMGFEQIKFVPSYFPYTEPSTEIYAWNKDRKVWIEIGGAGILRPEVVVPLLGEFIPVLAWGPGFDRALMDYYHITDLREFYENDLNKLRKIKFWLK